MLFNLDGTDPMERYNDAARNSDQETFSICVYCGDPIRRVYGTHFWGPWLHIARLWRRQHCAHSTREKPFVAVPDIRWDI
jgi:hypothetical protein